MTDHIYKSVELTGTSTTGVDDAVTKAVARASATLNQLRWFEVTQIRGRIDNDRVSRWQVTVKVSFTLDEA